MNGGGGRAPALPAPRSPRPRPAPPPPPRRIRFPHPRPGLPVSHWLLRPPVKAGPGGAGAQNGRWRESRVLGARPERPPSPRLARAQGTATDAAPAPSSPRRTPRCGQMWADVEAGRLHGGGAEGGEEIPPLPWGAGFLLREVLFTQPNKVRRRRRLPALSASKG